MMNKKCTVYQDGKIGRGVTGNIVKISARRVLIEFLVEDYDEQTGKWFDIIEPRWFVRRRRNNGGVYECVGWNYWFYWSRE